ncbi:MAG: TOBE domain-containing protein [Candidatus Rokuibacteriota bacterium]
MTLTRRLGALSIRPHDIVLGGAGTPADNRLHGAVRRATYLGDGVDYEVALTGTDVVLRVATAPASPRRAGDAVALSIPPAACVPLGDEA